MDSCVFIPWQNGCGKTDAKSRRLIRAYVTRRYWQAKYKQSSHVPIPDDLDSEFPLKNNNVVKTNQEENAALSDNLGRNRNALKTTVYDTRTIFVGPIRSIDRASDRFVYAGVPLEPRSCACFQHYAAEFKVLLCDRVQPLPINGDSVCCMKALKWHSPALLHAICFVGAAHEAMARAKLPLRPRMFRDPDYAHGFEKHALYHKNKALSHLRELFDTHSGENIASEALTLCIALLLASEAMMGDDASLESHENGLRQVVRACGGIQSFSESTASLVRLVDVKAAIARRRLPFFSSRHCLSKENLNHPSSLVTPLLENLGISHMQAVALTKSSLQLQLCSPLLQCISNIRCLMLVISTMSSSFGSMQPDYLDVFVAMEHFMVSLKYHYELTPLEECVRLALLLFSNTAFWRTPLFFNWVKVLTVDLKVALLLLDWTLSIEEHAELLLWIAFMGRYAVHYSANIDCEWWSEKIREIAAKAGIITFQSFKDVLHEFPFAEVVYGPTLEQSWDEDICRAPMKGSRTSLQSEKHPCVFNQIENVSLTDAR